MNHVTTKFLTKHLKDVLAHLEPVLGNSWKVHSLNEYSWVTIENIPYEHLNDIRNMIYENEHCLTYGVSTE